MNGDYELILEELSAILGREPTQAEIEDYIEQLEARWEDNMLSYIEDINHGHYNTD